MRGVICGLVPVGKPAIVPKSSQAEAAIAPRAQRDVGNLVGADHLEIEEPGIAQRFAVSTQQGMDAETADFLGAGEGEPDLGVLQRLSFQVLRQAKRAGDGAGVVIGAIDVGTAPVGGTRAISVALGRRGAGFVRGWRPQLAAFHKK